MFTDGFLWASVRHTKAKFKNELQIISLKHLIMVMLLLEISWLVIKYLSPYKWKDFFFKRTVNVLKTVCTCMIQLSIKHQRLEKFTSKSYKKQSQKVAQNLGPLVVNFCHNYHLLLLLIHKVKTHSLTYAKIESYLILLQRNKQPLQAYRMVSGLSSGDL